MHEKHGHVCQAQATGEGRIFQWPCGNTGSAAFSAQGTSAQTDHLRGKAGFVNEYQALRIEVRMEIRPLLSSFQDVCAFLLQCMRILF